MLLSTGAQLRAQPHSTIDRTIKIAGDQGWDYCTVDEVEHRLWVSHGNMVQVVDIPKGLVISTIEDTKDVHGIALCRDVQRAFISCGATNSIVVVDMKTLAKLSSIELDGKNPDAILYDAASKNVYVCNGRSASISVIDPVALKTVATIALDGKPEFAVSDAKGSLFVNIEDKSTVVMINTRTNQIEKTWNLAPGEGPSGLALDAFHGRLFSVCSNKLMIVLDTRNGRIIERVPIGDRCDGVVFDPVMGKVYTSNGEGTVTVVDASDGSRYPVVETISTARGARTIAVDAQTHKLYLPTADIGPPPAPTVDNPRPRPQIKTDSFRVIEISPAK